MDSGFAGILREPQEPAPRNDSAHDSNLKIGELASKIRQQPAQSDKSALCEIKPSAGIAFD